METEVSKVDAAVEQLDWAIKLFLDHQAYRSAITLAGAAEELLGKGAIGDRAAIEQLKGKFTGDLNEARNWLKHYSGPERRTLDWFDLSVQMIGRALSNLTVVTPRGFRRHSLGSGPG